MSSLESDPQEETKTLELSGRLLQRFEQLREQCKNDHIPAPSDEQMLKSLLDTWDAVEDGYYSDVDGHTFEVGDVLEKCDTSEWEITNRMVDVDTDEALYRLRETDTQFNETEILTESQVTRSFDVDAEKGGVQD